MKVKAICNIIYHKKYFSQIFNLLFYQKKKTHWYSFVHNIIVAVINLQTPWPFTRQFLLTADIHGTWGRAQFIGHKTPVNSKVVYSKVVYFQKSLILCFSWIDLIICTNSNSFGVFCPLSDFRKWYSTLPLTGQRSCTPHLLLDNHQWTWWRF